MPDSSPVYQPSTIETQSAVWPQCVAMFSPTLNRGTVAIIIKTNEINVTLKGHSSLQWAFLLTTFLTRFIVFQLVVIIYALIGPSLCHCRQLIVPHLIPHKFKKRKATVNKVYQIVPFLEITIFRILAAFGRDFFPSATALLNSLCLATMAFFCCCDSLTS